MSRPRSIDDATILTAARTLFLKKGPGASTKEVAALAGVSEGLLFQRYNTKADLFFAAMAPPAADPRTILPSAELAVGDLNALERAAFHILAYFREVMPLLLPLVCHPLFDAKHFFRHEAPTSLQAWIDALVEFLEAQRPNDNVEKDPRGAATLLMTSMFGIALIDTIGIHGAPMGDEEIRAVVRALWEGIAT
jgi:AcrR family transcriptional regulator